ncbi:hypothetical protein F4818DRAFT_445687 [Hypoxylon cercidicola]|nr:hypothetical protein F4818DRAFT_445687 [Hypoxylon cercidicola]
MLAKILPVILSVGRAAADSLCECVFDDLKNYSRTRKTKLTLAIVLKKVFGAMAGKVGEMIAPVILRVVGDLLPKNPMNQLLVWFGSNNTAPVKPLGDPIIVAVLKPDPSSLSAFRTWHTRLATRCNGIPPPSDIPNIAPELD